jgi:hypothetical protein
VNLREGKMLVEFETASHDDLEKWLASQNFQFDWLLRIEFESTGAGLQPVSKAEAFRTRLAVDQSKKRVGAAS